MIILKNIYIILSSIFFGGLVTWFAADSNIGYFLMDKQSVASSKNKDQIYDDIIMKQLEMNRKFDQLLEQKKIENDLTQEDIFKGLQNIRTEMDLRIKKLKLDSIYIVSPFDFLLTNKYGTQIVKDILFSEDQDFLFYDLIISDLKSTLISTSIDSGFITIFGTKKKFDFHSELKNNTESFSNSYYNSTFRQTLTLPENTDLNNMSFKLDYKKNKVTLKFPKMSDKKKL